MGWALGNWSGEMSAAMHAHSPAVQATLHHFRGLWRFLDILFTISTLHIMAWISAGLSEGHQSLTKLCVASMHMNELRL